MAYTPVVAAVFAAAAFAAAAATAKATDTAVAAVAADESITYHGQCCGGKYL